MDDNTIKVGDYLIIQKHNYKKLHKFNKPNNSITLGRDNINLTGIEGCPYFSVFKIKFQGGKKNKEFGLELTQEVLELKDEIEVKESGLDNRNIVDDGRSQKLTATEINELKGENMKPSELVETLISNSYTFHNKTEFSQEKYLKKKEKKYFEYIQILKPNLRIVSDILYKLDPTKIQNLRIDTISQIITLANIQSSGVHLLYDTGSNGLMAAALLSTIGGQTTGKLIHMHPGNMSQKQALLAMNFSDEQLNRCISVNIYSVLREFYQGEHKEEQATEDDMNKNKENQLKRKAEDTDISEVESKLPKLENATETSTVSDTKQVNDKNGKQSEPKKPKWYFDNIACSELLKKKVDSLVIVAKEDPQNIFNELLPFVKAGRPFIVYYSVAEPLQHLYMALKAQSNVAALKLTCNWMRNYQILPERTHPEVMMNNASGFLLSGYVLK